MSSTLREFVLRCVVEDIASLQERNFNFSLPEDHFSLTWVIKYWRHNGDLRVNLEPPRGPFGLSWGVKVRYTINIKLASRAQATSNFTTGFTQAEIRRPVTYGMISLGGSNRAEIEILVRINSSSGLPKKDLKCFDEPVEDLTDVVLIVEDRKFHVIRKFLASHSSYFKNLLLGNFQEAQSPEVTLPGVNAADFQNFLEVLYLEPAIDDNTVIGIHHLADMYDVEPVVRKCEKFLIEKSQLTVNEKLHFAMQHGMEDLKNDCLSKINTLEDIRSVLPADLTQLDPSLATALFEKAVAQNSQAHGSWLNCNGLHDA